MRGRVVFKVIPDVERMVKVGGASFADGDALASADELFSVDSSSTLLSCGAFGVGGTLDFAAADCDRCRAVLCEDGA
jgi:hypothetical protein